MKLRAVDIAEDLRGIGAVRAEGCGADVVFEGACTDTRGDVAGRLFVALRGDRFDAHAFLQQALDAGARGVLVESSQWERLPPGDYARLGVESPLMALQGIARASLRRARPRVVAITGSNGKTTTKDLTVAALGSLGRVHGTRGNLNNHIGVPLTVLGRRGDEDFLVAEAGMSGLGEIETLSRLLEPDVAAITNIGRAHLLQLGSVENVCRAKAEVLIGLRPRGIAVLNADDVFFPQLAASAAPARVASFGFARSAQYRIEDVRAVDVETQELRLNGCRVRLRRPGSGNARNAAAAIAIAVELGATLESSAEAVWNCEFTAQRSAWRRLGDVDVLDDSYNANPDSMQQALQILASRPGRKIAVLGDMLELGPDSASLHEEIGRQAAVLGVDLLLCTGSEMAHAVRAAAAAGLGGHAQHFDRLEVLVETLRTRLRPGDAVLVKGSRGSRMERVIAALGTEVA